MIKQLSVFVENKPGRMAAILEVLAYNGIDISALSIADTTDFGVLRMIVSDPDSAKKVLNDVGVVVKTTDVIGAYIDDKPGGLHEVLSVINDGKITIEYMYAFVGREENRAMVVLKVDDVESATELFHKANVKVK